MNESVLRLKDDDAVGVARHPLSPGDVVSCGQQITVRSQIPAGHKIALRAIGEGEPVTKYGYQIGVATQPIEPGEHVHTHNLTFSAHRECTAADRRDYTPPTMPLPERTTYQGIVRSDGRVGTRNFIALVSTVNCSATVTRMAARRVTQQGLLEDFPAIDGVVPLTHEGGCGMGSDGLSILQKTLSGYAGHPNVGGVVIIGLGCEMNQITSLVAQLNLRPDTPVVQVDIQTCGGTTPTIDAVCEAIREMAPQVNDVAREEVPVSTLVLGMECGGSDSLSGLTANPALGYASDLIAVQGGRTAFAETPEIYGAESMLVERAVSDEVAEHLLAKIRWWEQYTSMRGESMDTNPSPGNKAGGITTILEKSLGAVAKGGHQPLSAVYEYAEPITEPGMGFMDTPGYDPVSSTGLVAGGATLIAFTTGRGSAFGSKPAPTIKLATNSEIFQRMSGDMDIDCGTVFTGQETLADKGLEIYNFLLDVASGTRSASEVLDYGDDEFIPWHIGVVM